jgi:GxxExxY protein
MPDEQNANIECHEQAGYDFMAAAFAVYNELGNGFLEEIYHESLEMELADRKIPFVSKPKLTIYYKGRPLNKKYEAGFIIAGEIIVELKAAKTILPEHEAQLLNYLKATRKHVGCIVNFGAHSKLQWQRRIL